MSQFGIAGRHMSYESNTNIISRETVSGKDLKVPRLDLDKKGSTLINDYVPVPRGKSGGNLRQNDQNLNF
jgi:hypothetical protein